ncbi:MAG: hypothetical protein RBS05_12435 [Zoogloea oleivorans]|jgi:hypothetical protein|nr:hypothetical protein [Zoogloea oleivorans]
MTLTFDTKAPAGDILIYEFGARIDPECAPAINEQITLARRMYNDIVAYIRDTVAEAHACVLAHAGPEAHALQAQIDALTERFKAAKAADDEPAMKDIAAQRRQAWSDLGTMLKSARKLAKADTAPIFARIGKRSTCGTYQIRCSAVTRGLGWATANAVLDAALQAFKKSFMRGQAPRFSVGAEKIQDTLSLQFTAAGGLNVADLLTGRNAELSIAPPPAGAGRRRYGEFRFRLGPAQAGIYATGTWQYHRPIPEGARIGLARLIRRRVGKDTKWALQLMVRTPEPVRIESGHRAPLAAVHFGWAADLDGRRIAAIADSADPGNARILRLPAGVEDGLRRSAEAQAERDSLRDSIIERVKALDLGAADETLHAEHAALKRLPAQHIAIRRLHRLCHLLREADRLPDWLAQWRLADRALWQRSAHTARRARNARRSYYRETAIDLARRYDTIVIEPLDLAEAAIKVDEVTGEKTDFTRRARAGRVVAALYEFESAIRWAGVKTQSAVLDLVAPTVSLCAHCGSQSVQPDEADYQTLHCADCGAATDRKLNGAAMAWQIAAEEREEAVTEYWLHHAAAQRERAAEQAEKKRKLAQGRADARARADAAKSCAEAPPA